MLQIKNSKTKQVKEVSAEDFDKIQKNELTKGKWFVIEKAKTPPEVKEFEEKKKSEAMKEHRQHRHKKEFKTPKTAKVTEQPTQKATGTTTATESTPKTELGIEVTGKHL